MLRASGDVPYRSQVSQIRDTLTKFAQKICREIKGLQARFVKSMRWFELLFAQPPSLCDLPTLSFPLDSCVISIPCRQG